MPRCLSTGAWLCVLLLAGASHACSGGTEPSTNPFDVRLDPRARGRVAGYVYGMARDGASQPLAGITVELGRWEGTVVDDQYGTRTAQRREPPWARLVVIARTVTDAHGRYEFAQAPAGQVLGIWPRAPADSVYEDRPATSTFWLRPDAEQDETVFLWRRGQWRGA